ncbi:hypothetical protein CN230_31380 [Sinorhizobium meliloti]|nr:hypothetical protein CN230_31380 [Sinorhizobium meliloti]
MVARLHPRGPAIIDLSVEQYAEKMPLTPDPARHKSLLMCHDHLQQDGLTLTRDMTGDGPLKSFPCYTPEIGDVRTCGRLR